jgi:uncharacterized protein YodC (DUF2158 family)
MAVTRAKEFKMPEQQDISAGDTVKLKSGGPLMTVTYVESDEYGTTINVSWFDGKDQPQSGSYPAAALEKW